MAFQKQSFSYPASKIIIIVPLFDGVFVFYLPENLDFPIDGCARVKPCIEVNYQTILRTVFSYRSSILMTLFFNFQDSITTWFLSIVRYLQTMLDHIFQRLQLICHQGTVASAHLMQVCVALRTCRLFASSSTSSLSSKHLWNRHLSDLMPFFSMYTEV